MLEKFLVQVLPETKFSNVTFNAFGTPQLIEVEPSCLDGSAVTRIREGSFVTQILRINLKKVLFKAIFFFNSLLDTSL